VTVFWMRAASCSQSPNMSGRPMPAGLSTPLRPPGPPSTQCCSWRIATLMSICCGNNAHGPGQYPEKLISRFILRAMQGAPPQVQGDGSQQRSFLYVDDFVAAAWKIANKGTTGAMYNIKSDDELSVLQVAQAVYDQLQIPDAQRKLQHVPDRKFNDRRSWIQNDKLRGLGWRQSTTVRQGLKATVDWYTATCGGGRLRQVWPSANEALTALDADMGEDPPQQAQTPQS
jgi:hypothetical protein